MADGTLPAAGGWVRLEVPAERVGMVGKSISGIDFIVASGRAAFDDTGVNSKPAGPAASQAWWPLPRRAPRCA